MVKSHPSNFRIITAIFWVSEFFRLTHFAKRPIMGIMADSVDWVRWCKIWAMSWDNLFMPYANNKGADQPANPRSLISAFVVHCLDSIIHLVSISKLSSLYLASVAVQAGLCQPWSQTLKTSFLVTKLFSSYNGDHGRQCRLGQMMQNMAFDQCLHCLH